MRRELVKRHGHRPGNKESGMNVRNDILQRETRICRGGAPPTGFGGPKNFLLLKEQKETMATSRSRRRIHPPTKSGARFACVVGDAYERNH
jgi:hypothetical protein